MTTSTKFNVLLLAFLTPALAAAAAVKPVVSTIEDHVAVPIQLSDHVPINYKCEFSIGGANGATLPVSNGNLGHAVGVGEGGGAGWGDQLWTFCVDVLALIGMGFILQVLLKAFG
ncbi:hypothetical protein HDK64DRAFT_261242 [Phyllosticta capitalensis]